VGSRAPRSSRSARTGRFLQDLRDEGREGGGAGGGACEVAPFRAFAAQHGRDPRAAPGVFLLRSRRRGIRDPFLEGGSDRGASRGGDRSSRRGGPAGGRGYRDDHRKDAAARGVDGERRSPPRGRRPSHHPSRPAFRPEGSSAGRCRRRGARARSRPFPERSEVVRERGTDPSAPGEDALFRLLSRFIAERFDLSRSGALAGEVGGNLCKAGV